MEINNNSSIIKEVLSLRYCPSIKSTKNKFIVNDFMPEEKLDYLKHIENCISSEIKKEVSDNHVSVALSGGIDSTLVMALLRKTKPDIKIDAISLKFADSVDETSESTAPSQPSYSKGVNLKAQAAKTPVTRQSPKEKKLDDSNPDTEIRPQVTGTTQNDVG